MKETWHASLIKYMLSHGYVEIPSTSKKYRMFKPTRIVGADRRYYVGKKGAIRSTSDGTLASSISVTDIFKKYVALWQLKEERDNATDGSDL